MVLVETWTNQHSNLTLPGYEYLALHRPKCSKAKRSSGGIVVYYKSELSRYVSLYKQSDDNVLWLKIDKSLSKDDKDIFICVCYITPSNSKVQTSDVLFKIT